MSLPTDVPGAMPFAPVGGGAMSPVGTMPDMGFGPGPFMFPGSPPASGNSPPSDKDNKDRMQSELQRVRFRAQFAKTEMCRYYRSGCRNGLACPYAHGDHEVMQRPDLTKTSLCRAWSKNACPLSKEECRFAHGASDLRATPLYEKIAICKAFTHGRCKLGTSCRFAHSAEELHMDQTALNAQMLAGMAAFGGGGSGGYGPGGKKSGGEKGGGKKGMGGGKSGSVVQPPWLGEPGSMGPSGGMPFGQIPMGAVPGHHGNAGDGEGHNQGDFVPYMMPGPLMSMPVMMQGAMMPHGGPAPVPPPAPMPSATAAASEPKKDVQLMVKCKQGGSVKFKIKAAMPLRKLMDAFCARKNLQRADVRFFVGDKEISPEDTATKLGLTDDSQITAEVTKDD